MGSGGGSVWESNPPETLLRPHTGFEDQASHQARTTPVGVFSFYVGGTKEVKCLPNDIWTEGSSYERFFF